MTPAVNMLVAAGFLRLVTHPRLFVVPLCRQHQLVGNAISDGWIAAAVLASRQELVSFALNFLPLLPSRRLVLLEG